MVWWMRMLHGDGRGQRGAALVIVLLFMVVALILITAALAVTGNEIQISGLHRDSVRALELAHGGLAEGIQRIINNHPFLTLDPVPGMVPCADGTEPMGFPSSLAPAPSLRVGVCGALTGQFIEVRAEALVGRAVRRLSQLIRVTARDIPPEIVLLQSAVTSGSAGIPQGEAYASDSIAYSGDSPDRTYAGFYVGQKSGQTINACYGRQQAYVLKAANSGLGDGADFSRELSPGTEAAGSIAVSVAGGVGVFEDSYGYTRLNDPSTDGGSGGGYTYTIEVNVTGGNSGIDIQVTVARVNSSGTVQASHPSFSVAQRANPAGVQTHTLTNVDLGTWASGDRLRVTYRFVNRQTGANSLTIQTGTVNAETYPGWAPNCPYDDTNTPANNWYPGTRLTVFCKTESGACTDATAQDIVAGTGTPDPGAGCPVASSTMASDISPGGGVKAEDPRSSPGAYDFPIYGFDTDDPDGGGPILAQAKTNLHPCGLPYKYVLRNVTQPDGTTVPRFFKTIIYEQWFETYYRFQVNPPKIEKRDGTKDCTQTNTCVVGSPGNGSEPNLAGYPQFGAVPPYPAQMVANIAQNAAVITNPGPHTNTDFGTLPADPTSCPATGGDPRLVRFRSPPPDPINYNVEYTISSGQGFGAMVVDGNLRTVGNFTYRGSIFTRSNPTNPAQGGRMDLGAGTVTIHGGLIAQGPVSVSGNLTIIPTDCIGITVFSDLPLVEFGPLWER